MKYKIIFGAIILLIIGYILGQYIPTEFLKPQVNQNPIELKDYYGLLVQIIAAVATLLAVVAALFREEIRRWWEYVKIDYSIPKENFREIINPNTGNSADGAKTTIEAEKYVCEMEVINNGTVSSLTSEIVLESMLFKSSYSNTHKPIDTIGTPLNWGNTQESRVTIPPKGKKKVPILELIPPDKESSPGGNENTTSPKIIIMGVDTDLMETEGMWTATYLIYSSNFKPNRFIIEIKWNGRWHGRMTEMKDCLTIDLKK